MRLLWEINLLLRIAHALLEAHSRRKGFIPQLTHPKWMWSQVRPNKGNRQYLLLTEGLRLCTSSLRTERQWWVGLSSRGEMQHIHSENLPRSSFLWMCSWSQQVSHLTSMNNDSEIISSKSLNRRKRLIMRLGISNHLSSTLWFEKTCHSKWPTSRERRKLVLKLSYSNRERED